MVKKFLLPMFFILLFATGAAAQTRVPLRGTDSADKSGPSDKRPKDADQNVNFPEDMRIKMAIERADSEYRKAIEDADKMNDLSAEIAKSYRDNGRLGPDELKKVGTIEKLAKRILSQAGGDEVDDKSKPAPRPLSEVIEQMSTAAANIQKSIKAQTRFVVSATVIANSNEVINLAQFIRHSIKAD